MKRFLAFVLWAALLACAAYGALAAGASFVDARTLAAQAAMRWQQTRGL